MKVEILYVAECHSRSAAVKLVKDVLAAQGVTSEIQEVLVRDERMANEFKFLGSPTIRINGRDVVRGPKQEQSFALCCRLYSGSDDAGLPPTELIRSAVVNAQKEKGGGL